MQLPSKRWIKVIILSLGLIGWAQPGMTQSYPGMTQSYAGVPLFGGLPLDALPDDVRLQAHGAAFFWLAVPTRILYVGEAVPVEIDVGIRQGLTVTLNGLPILEGSDFTLNKISRQADSRKTFIDGSYFDVLTWHTALAAVKSGDFSLSAGLPMSANIGGLSAAHGTVTSRIVSKDIVIESIPFMVRVLPLPAEGQPQNFSGAVGDFQVSGDISPISVKEGEPLTLRLHVRGKGDFARVDSAMFEHLDHWRTYPAKSVFTPSDAAGNRGEKVFEQTLIATEPGEQSIPAIDFNYFSPGKRRYEHAQTRPIRVTVAASSLSSLPVPAAPHGLDGAPAAGPLPGLRSDHLPPRATMGELRPLYFRGAFLTLLTGLALLLPVGWFGARPNPARATSKATARALARLDVAARAGDVLSFFEVARNALLQTLAARWRMPAEQITGTELRARLGTAGEDIERLFAIADEAKYGGGWSSGADLQHWLGVIRGQLACGRQ